MVPFVVCDEVREDGGGDDVPNVLRVLPPQTLEGDPHAAPVRAEGGPTRVAAVDGSVDLEGGRWEGRMRQG